MFYLQPPSTLILCPARLREQFNDLYDRAWGTALAQNPPPLTVPPDWIPTITEPLTLWPTDPRIPAGAGWISNAQGPRPFPLIANIYNFWVERTDDQRIIVYAGSLSDNAAQGAVLIQRLNALGPIDAEPEIYTALLQAGGLRLVDAVGERLTLRADDGTLFYFDVPTRQWVTPDPTPASSSDPTPVTTYVPTYVIYAQRVQATAEAIAPTIPTPSLQQGTYGDIYFVGATGESTQTFGGGAAWQKLWPALHGTTCTGARPMTFTTTAGYCIPDPTCP